MKHQIFITSIVAVGLQSSPAWTEQHIGRSDGGSRPAPEAHGAADMRRPDAAGRPTPDAHGAPIDESSRLQFKIQKGTSDAQDAETLRSDADKRREDHRKDLYRNWGG